ncbi:hypothetical protein [Streptomyces neyagawaensis]|uniref:hypothetical protein n=1 Tax=Streptomyces neyagawaensis TaxID=42238 RepID=UPI0012FECB28|nr:hypothetical protein [Streptomyces neyagawaensis]MCL6734804.1 hypothetical protein [Streptomyces neyagawaensis]MDE1686530.1 hypothetical protein [Streptomyces neyagawaensis]
MDILEDLVASPGDWNQVGYGGNPVAGNPRVLDGFTRDFRLLRDLAADVDAGLDTMLRTASDGGFEGKTADALRTYVKQSLKKFMANAHSAFDLAASATARYANALRDAQGRAERAAERGGAVAIPPAGLVGKNAPPPAELTAAKNDVEAEVDFITGEATILEDALRTAADMVSSPIAPPKKSLKQRIVEGLWKTLEIVTIVISIAAMIVGGPLGLLAFGLSAVLFGKALVDYRQGKLNGVGLGLAFLGVLFPSTKGLTTAGGLLRMLKAGASIGAKGAGRALSGAGRLVMQAGRLVMAPRTLGALAGQGMVKLFRTGSGMFVTGMSRLPGLVAGTPRALMGAMRMAGGFARGVMRSGWFALRRDFFMASAFVGGGMGRRLGVYALTNVGRAFDFALSALLPLRYAELAKYGFRGAWRMGILERGLLRKPSVGGAVGRTVGSVGDLAARTGRGLSTPDAAKSLGERGKLVVPGTLAWDDAVDELTEFMPPPTGLARSTSTGSLPRFTGMPSGRFSSTLDDLVEPTAFRDLDALGSRSGPLLRSGAVDVADLHAGGLLSPQFRNALDALDDLDELAGTGTAVRSPLLEQPRSAVARLRDLDAFTGMDRTGTGLLKPMDELAELAPFSIDGKFGGLTTVQVRKILDGEIDLVDVVPDGVILRIGKTDPVNVHVRLKGEVTVRVLDPDEPVPGPPAGKFTGVDSPAGLGFRLDELARLLPDRPGELGRARELLGLGPVKTDLAPKPVTAQPGFPPLTLREIITGGAVGKTGADRFQAWVRAQNAALDLDTAGQKLAQVTDLPHVSPLHRAEAELDLSAAELKFNHARLAFDRLGMNLDTVRQNITVMMVRLDGPGAHLPVGELRLLDDLARPTGQWITMEPGERITYVLRTDAGIVPDVRVAMVDGHFTVTAPDGIVTRFGPDGAPLRVDVPMRPETPAGPSTVHGAAPAQVDVPVLPQVHWLVRQDMDFAASSLKSGMKSHLTTEGLVPAKIDGTITSVQAVTTANAKAFKAESPFTAFSPPGSIVKSYGNQEIGLDLIALRNDINAGVENVRNVEILSTSKVQDAILDEIRFKTGLPDLEVPSTFTHTTGNKEIQEFLAKNGVAKRVAANVTADIKTLLQVRRDNTWLIKGTIPANYLKGPYPTVDSLKHIPAAPSTPLTAATNPLESAGRASGSGLPPVELPKPVLKSDDFYMSRVELEDLRGIKLVRQDDFHMVQQDLKGLRKSYFDPDVGMIPANPEGRTTAFQHVAGAENATRKSNSPFTSFAEIGNHKTYGDMEFSLDAYKLGVDIKAGRLPDVGILPAKDLQRLIADQIERTIGKRLDFTSALSGNSSRQDVLNFLKSHDVNPAKSNKFVADVRVLLNTTRDQEWLVKGTIPKSYLEGPYPRAGASSGIGDALSAGPLSGLDEAAGKLRLSDTFKTDVEAKPVFVEPHGLDGVNSGAPRIGEVGPTGKHVLFDGPAVPAAPVTAATPPPPAPLRPPPVPSVRPAPHAPSAPPVPALGKGIGGTAPVPPPPVGTHGLGSGLDAGTPVVRHAPGGDTSHWVIDGKATFGRYKIRNTDDGSVSLVSASDRAWATLDNAAASRQVFEAEQLKRAAEQLKKADLQEGGKYLSSGYRSINPLLAAFEEAGYTAAQVRHVGFDFSERAADVLENWKRVATERGYASREVTESWDLQDLHRWHDSIKSIHRAWDDFPSPAIPGNAVVRGDSWQIFSSFDGILDPGHYPGGGYHDVGRTISWPGIMSTTTGSATTHNFVNSKALIWKFDVPEQGHPGRVLGSENLAEAEVTFPVNTQIKINQVLVRDGHFAHELADEFGDKAKVIVFADILPAGGAVRGSVDELAGGVRAGDAFTTNVTRLDRFDAPAPRAETVLLRPEQVAGTSHVRVEWERVPLDGGGFRLTDETGGARLVFGADEVLQFRDHRVPGTDGFLRFEAAPGPDALPRWVGADGMPLAGTGAVVDPVRGALGVVTGVKAGTPDGAWTARFDLDGTPLSEELRLSGHAGGALTDARLVTTLTRGPGGDLVPSLRLTAPGLGDGAFSVVRLPGGEAAGRLPAGGFAVTDLASGDRFVFDRAGRFVDFAADVPPVRVDAAGTTVPETVGTTLPDPNVGPLTAVDDFGGPLSERFPLHSLPEHHPLDGAAADLPRIELPGADAPAIARAADVALPAGPPLTRLTEFQDVPLSGAGDLAGLEFRIVGGDAADGVPGTFLLDVTRAVPEPHGTGPQPRFTVERLDSGTFRVTDPAGTTRWEFGAGGEFLARETALVDHDLGLPSGLWFRNTATTTTDGITSRIVGLVGPREVTDSFPLTTVDRTLQDRLPGGFTLTDSVSGSRFHYDADLNLAFRDLPARDGSGFLRFTEGASDVPPVRLDDLGGSSGLDDLAGIFQRTLDEASGGARPMPDVTDVSLGAAPRLPGLDDAAARRLSDALGEHGDQWLTRLSQGDAPDLDLRAAWRALDEHWTGLLERTPGIRLTGADDLADLEIRMLRVPSTDTAPGSFRLELLDRAPAADGTVRGADFTVERIPDGGFALTDPTGNTTWTFAQDGSFLGREAALTGEGLPSGLRVSATHNEAGGFTQVDLLGPDSSVRSLRVTAPEGELAGRLPGGFTLTDTVTGSRFHFDRTGAVVFRDLPAHDGSGFLRFTEGARAAQPTRLVDPLSERFPLTSIPEEDLLDEGLTDLSQLFDRTLDEASGIRADLPGEAAAADLSSISAAMEFLHAAPDSHAVQNLDLLHVRQLAGDATDSLNRFPGLRPELLHDQLRQMTAQAHEGIRQGAATVLREYQNLPLAARLEDLRSGGSRVYGDFTVTPTPHGGPGGSRFTVTHTPTDLTTGFGPNRELLHREVFVRGGPAELDGTRLGLTGRTAEGGWTPDSFQFVGTHVADDAFTLTRLEPTLPADLRGGFTVTDAAGTTKWHYGPEGALALRDVQLVGDGGVFRFEAGAPDGAPRVLDPSGNASPTLRAERLDDGRIALIHTGPGTPPLERTVFDASGGKLLEETFAIRGSGGKPTGSYWTIDHVTGKGVRVNGDNTPFTSRFDTATLETSPTGQFKLTGKEPGKVTLFEREVLNNGNTLHIARDRFGHAHWTEFDNGGNRVRSGERIGDPDQRTYHDVPDGSWRLLNTSDVRTYHKALDGGLVRAEKGADGHWTWQRFDKDGVEALSGTRRWSANHVAFEDTFLDPATGLETVAQRRSQTWPFGGLHGSRMYQEHSLLPGHAPAGTRIDPGTYVGQGPSNAQIESLETLADGGSLLVERFADMRPPAFLWKGAAGRNPFDNFFGDLFAGDSLNRVSHWTQTAADGTTVTGVRLNPSAANWVDVDEFGRVVRESRKLDDGSVIEIGRSADDAPRWAPLPEYREGAPYELHWRNTKTGETGTRHADGLGQWRDVFTDSDGVERVRLRSEGAGSREYLFDAPTPHDLAHNDRAGVWVDRNSLLHVTGRRDAVGDVYVESSGSPYRTDWTWKSYDSDNPATVLDEGIRKQNRGSLYSRTWDDSFVDLDRLGNVVRERNATDVGASWVDAVRQPDGTYTWTKTAADGTVHSEGVRVYDDVAKGRWRDLIDDQVVRSRDGGRVREYAYEIVTSQPPASPAADVTRATTLRDLLEQSARHFEPPRTVRVDREAWKEYDLGKVFRERVKVDGDPVRYREVDKQWGQWREYQNGHLVEQRVFDGRVYRTDAFGRLSMAGPAVIPHYLGGVLPRVGGEVGLPGDRAWQLIGREADYRGADIEALGYLREVQDPWHGLFQGVRNGESVEMPLWQRELRSFLTSFSTGFVTDLTAGLLITELTNNGSLKPEDVFKALLSGAVGGTFGGGLNILYNHTRLGYLKTTMGQLDWAAHPKQSMAGLTDDWATDWTAFEKPTRWRTATYANTVGLATGALSGFVSTAISSAVFGVNGNEIQGADALRAGMWGAAGSLFGGVSTGLARNAWHLATGARVFHKGGLGELGMNWVESALSKYIAFQIAQADSLNGNHLPSPGRAFPKPVTVPAAPPPAPAPQPPADQPDAPVEGLELP